MQTERCRECQGGLFDRRRKGNSPNRARILSRYPPDGTLRDGEQVYCVRCRTPHRARYSPDIHDWSLKQDGPIGRRSHT